MDADKVFPVIYTHFVVQHADMVCLVIQLAGGFSVHTDTLSHLLGHVDMPCAVQPPSVIGVSVEHPVEVLIMRDEREAVNAEIRQW
jgi:hypothetical protein